MTIGQFVQRQTITDRQRAVSQWKTQQVAIFRAVASIEDAVMSKRPPAAGTLQRALYDEHIAAIARGELRSPWA